MGVAGWLILLVILLLIEIYTLGLTTIWFAGGALVAMILAYFDVPLAIQIIAFLLVSGALLLLTRPIAIKYFNKDREKTNTESLIGQKAVVLENIDNLHGTGRAEINGMEWTARAADPQEVIEAGQVVLIQEIQGVKLIVTKEKEAEETETE